MSTCRLLQNPRTARKYYWNRRWYHRSHHRQRWHHRHHRRPLRGHQSSYSSCRPDQDRNALKHRIPALPERARSNTPVVSSRLLLAHSWPDHFPRFDPGDDFDAGVHQVLWKVGDAPGELGYETHRQNWIGDLARWPASAADALVQPETGHFFRRHSQDGGVERPARIGVGRIVEYAHVAAIGPVAAGGVEDALELARR